MLGSEAVRDDEQGAVFEQPKAKSCFLAVPKDSVIQARTKKELRKALEANGDLDSLIVRGKILPTRRVTKVAF